MAFLGELQTSPEGQSDMYLSLARLGELHDSSHRQGQPCLLDGCYARQILSCAGDTED